MFLWNIAVTSLVEVWIEMMIGVTFNDPASLSLPLWKCGLKYAKGNHYNQSLLVTSLVEVWIEILCQHPTIRGNMSLPLWKCGLKSNIPIALIQSICHFPCGSVD